MERLYVRLIPFTTMKNDRNLADFAILTHFSKKIKFKRLFLQKST